VRATTALAFLLASLCTQATAEWVTATVVTGHYPRAAAVNPVTNKVYVANQYSGNVTMIDGATNDTTAVAAHTNPAGVAVNPVTNRIY
jgi:YVTN family beta-propeller protein